MNYKNLIERLNNAAGGPAGRKMCQDAAKAITDLLIRAEKAERERDAAIKDMKQNTKCYICKHYPEDNVIAHCKLFRECGLAYANWEWRGLKEE